MTSTEIKCRQCGAELEVTAAKLVSFKPGEDRLCVEIEPCASCADFSKQEAKDLVDERDFYKPGIHLPVCTCGDPLCKVPRYDN